MTASQRPENPTVFISYAHETINDLDMGESVKALVDYLTANDVQVISDHRYANSAPPKGWRAWMTQSIEDADLVYVVCTQRYKQLFEKRHDDIEGGYGVSWESAIISAELYEDRLVNEKIFPLLHDNGDHQDIPKILRDFGNDWRFPSGMARILGHIRDLPEKITPKHGFQYRVPAELHGHLDNRLASTDNIFLGRDEEVTDVIDFLNNKKQPSASVIASIQLKKQVTGTGGIGKTEVCRAALARWLKEQPDETVYWIDVAESSDEQLFLTRFAQTMGAIVDQLPDKLTFENLKHLLKPGLYYLDNLEHALQSIDIQHYIQQLINTPNIRVLASSRVDNDALFGQAITIERLDNTASVDLFKHHWPTHSPLPEAEELSAFLEQHTGGHPLTIKLLAVAGKHLSWQKLVTRWNNLGVTLAAQRQPLNARTDSLQQSLMLTVELLKEQNPTSLTVTLEQQQQALAHQGVFVLWQLAALFPDGIDSAVFEGIEKTLAIDLSEARTILLEHHIFTTQDNHTLQLLPPIARFAHSYQPLEQQGTTQPQPPAPFNWQHSSSLAYHYLIPLATIASDTKSSPLKTTTRQYIGRLLPVVRTLFKQDAAQKQRQTLALSLHQSLHNVYWFFPLSAQDILNLTLKWFQDGLSALRLGDITNRLGDPDKTRSLYQQAIQHYQNEQHQLGLAHALKALGDLDSRLGYPDKARSRYQQAIQHYQNEQDQLGLANALQALGDLDRRLGYPDKARSRYQQAIQHYQNEQHQLGLANALLALGVLESRLGYPDKARSRYQQAIQHYQNEQDQLGLANALEALGDLDSQLGYPDKARSRYQQAIQHYQNEQDQLGLANALKALGDLDRQLGYPEKARSRYQQAIQHYQNEQHQLGIANVYLRQGNLLLEAQHPELALEKYQQALTLYLAEQTPSNSAYTCAEIIRCFKALAWSQEQTVQKARMGLLQAKASNIESVMKYVLKAIYEYCDEDEKSFVTFLTLLAEDEAVREIIADFWNKND